MTIWGGGEATEPGSRLGLGEVDSVQQKGEFTGTKRDAGLAGKGDRPGEAAFLQSFGAYPQTASIKDEEFQASLLAIGEQEEVAAERIFAEGVTDESEEAVEALAHVDGIDGDEDAGGRREAEHELVGVSGGEEFQEEISGAGEMGQAGGGEFDAAAIAQDDGTVGDRRERRGLPFNFKELGLARADLATVVVEGMDGDAEAGGVGGAGLAAGGEVLSEIEELLTGAAGAFHPYTSAHGGGVGKAGVSRSDTIQLAPVMNGFDFHAPVQMHRAVAVLVVAKGLDGQRLQCRLFLSKHDRHLTLGGAVNAGVLPGFGPGRRGRGRLSLLSEKYFSNNTGIVPKMKQFWTGSS